MVTGGTGNVGLSLVRRLAADPAVRRIRAVSRRRPADGVLPDGVEWCGADMSAALPAGLFAGADAVVHLAWLFQPTRRPDITWTANAQGSGRVFAAALEAGVPTLVHASSVGAYRPRRSLARVDEDHPTDGIPTSAYSREKAYVERLLDAVEATGRARVVRLRPAFILRRGSAVQQRRLFAGPFVPGSLLARRPPPVLPDPDLHLQTVHTDDVAAAYQLALHADVRGAFNVAAEPVLGTADIAELVGARTTVHVPPALVRAAAHAAWAAHLTPTSPGMLDLLLRVPMLDATRARAELGWEPVHDARAAMADVLAGLRDPRGDATPPLAPATSGPLRSHEVATGIGERA